MERFSIHLTDALRSLNFGDHLCLIYRNRREQFAAVMPFIKQGLEKGEKCLYIVDERTAREVKDALQQEGVDVQGCLDAGRLSILTKEDVYLKEGYFDPDKMIALLAESTEAAVREGYPGLRITGEMTWVLAGLPGSERLIEYEARLGRFFPGSKALAICQYNEARFSPELLLDMLATHPLVSAGGLVCHNFYYVPPDEFLREKRDPQAEYTRYLRHIQERERLELALREHSQELECKVQEKMAEAEARYRSLFDGVPVGLYRSTPAGQILDANPALVKMLGYPDREALLAVNVADTFVDREERRRWQALMERAGVVRDFEMRVRRHDGTVIWVQDSARAVRDGSGRVLYYEGSLKDITERVRAEEALRRRAEELAALHAISLDITAPHDLPTLLQTIVERAVRLLDAPAGALYLCDPDREEARCVVSYNTRHDHTGVVLKYGQGAAGAVAETGKPLILNDYPTWPGRTAVHGEELPFTALLSVPMIWQDQVTGVIHVLHHAEDRRFTQADLELLTLFANQAAIAVENARLLQAEHEQRQLAEALRDTAEALNSTLNFDEVVERILTNVGRVVPHDTADIMLIESGFARIVGSRGYAEGGLKAPVLGRRFPVADLPSLRQMAETGQPLAIPDTQADPGWVDIPETRWVRSYAGAPIRLKGQVVGFLNLTSTTPGFFTPAHAERLQAFADQAGVAIENARLFDEIKQRAMELSTLLEAVTAVSSTLHLEEVVALIAEQMVKATGVDGCALSRWDQEAEAIVTWIEVRQDAERPEEPGTSYALDDFPATRAVLERRQPIAVLATDPHADPAEVALMREMGVVSLLMLPLAVGERVIGLVELDESEREREFTTAEIRLCQALADQAAVAIENARLFDETRRRAAHQEALNAVIAAAAAAPDLPELLETALEHTLRALELEMGAIWVEDQYAVRGLPSEMEPTITQAMQDTGLGIPGPIVAEDWQQGAVGHRLAASFQAGPCPKGAPALEGFPPTGPSPQGASRPKAGPNGGLRTPAARPEGSVELSAVGPLMARLGIRASITVPLLIGEQRIGGLSVAAPEPHRWSAEEVVLVEAIGRQVGAAVERVRLLEQEQRRSQQLTLVAQIARRAGAQLDPDALLWETARALQQAFNYPDVLIALVDHDRQALVRKAWAGGYQRTGPAEQTKPIADQGILDWVVTHGQTALANDVRRDPRYLTFLPDTASELCVPIKDGDTVIGCINVESNELYAFGEADVMALETLADELAVALRNAELFADKQRKIAELAALNQVGQALVATLELDELLAVIHREVTAVMMAEAFFIALYDAEANEMDYRIRVDREVREPPERRPPRGMTGQIMATGQPILIRDWQREKEEYPQPKAWGTMEIPDSWLGVPMKVGERVVGVISVQAYHPHAYDEGHLDLLSTIAGMAAVAVERARLYREVRERARRFEQLSQRLMALQETGRAVSSLLDSMEALRAVQKNIARILPEALAPLFALVDEEAGVIRPVLLDPESSALVHFTRLTGMDLEDVAVPLLALDDSADWARLLTGEAIVTHDISAALSMAIPLPALAAAQKAFGIQSTVFLPLRAQERLHGLMLVFARRQVDADELGLLEALAAQAAVALQNACLYNQLEEAYVEAILALANAMDVRDSYTGNHSQRLAAWAEATARELGCNEAEVEAIRWGALLHDIGKLGVPDEILRKPGPLTEAEWTVMKRHPQIGAEIVAPVKRLANVAPIIRHHQEKWDGTGYPDGLKGRAIPLGARVLAVVDAYGAMIDKRVYRGARSHAKAVAELRRCAGTHFDPRVVEVFLSLLPEESERAGTSIVRHRPSATEQASGQTLQFAEPGWD